MLKKGSKLNSILTGTCPKCQKESMYVDKNPYHLGNVLKMNEDCSSCRLHYQIEPSFFYGAMYVSYGLNVAIGIATFIISKIIFDSTLKTSFIAIITVLILTAPLILRWSRNIYINMFVDYDPTLNHKEQSTKHQN
ncbi:DUF983 domain-containing protein [Flavobacterium sp. 7A]|uniref:DUF983 domain-containing protein n=1 Tax=Flavobacterium sp. 7A TaxID=2940571 RepID=UPI002227D622|nr:DUF983 domain-containing protein [Flavobacterium sp. 7A]MCW2119065.1 uncharacterized protein (DUF983 family) [Flavobacterium sp. 7A]